jgi:hypothetical protein
MCTETTAIVCRVLAMQESATEARSAAPHACAGALATLPETTVSVHDATGIFGRAIGVCAVWTVA